MKYLKVFESFENSDVNPRYSKEFSILAAKTTMICKEYGISNWKLNSDGGVDVDGNVDISYYRRLTKLPLKFGKVTGNFWTQSNKLTSLEGSPREVGGGFFCQDNKLTTLEGGPIYVGRDFDCSTNDLITLEGLPKKFGDFVFINNPIWNVYELFPDIKSFLESMDYNYLRGKSIDKIRFKESLEELNIEIPESIPGWKYI